MSKTGTGNFFEDFRIGQEIRHATARTVTAGEAALYLAMTGSRFLQHCSDPFARSNGLPAAPFEDLLTFHLVFGRTVPDVSLNAVANLGYADGRFLGLVYPGDTLLARSEVIGLKETSSGQTGIVWVRSQGFKSDGTPVLDYVPLGHGPQARPGARRRRTPVTPDLPSHVTARPAGRARRACACRGSTRSRPARPTSSRTSWSASRSTMSTAWA